MICIVFSISPLGRCKVKIHKFGGRALKSNSWLFPDLLVHKLDGHIQKEHQLHPGSASWERSS